MKTTRLLTMLLAAGALGTAAPAEAACTISTTAVNFGSYNVFSASPDNATGQVTYRCTAPRPPLVTIQLDKGGAPTFNPRQMRMGSEVLSYNLYLDSTRTTIWGDGTGGSQTYTRSNPPTNQNIKVSVFGRIPAGQDVSAGSYSATVTATIFF
ncbi:MAG TPA: spore coat U domain-containing protein [Methylomirabilota bacterium]|jgi:spore coat protein U-like protein